MQREYSVPCIQQDNWTDFWDTGAHSAALRTSPCDVPPWMQCQFPSDMCLSVCWQSIWCQCGDQHFPSEAAINTGILMITVTHSSSFLPYFLPSTLCICMQQKDLNDACRHISIACKSFMFSFSPLEITCVSDLLHQGENIAFWDCNTNQNTCVS